MLNIATAISNAHLNLQLPLDEAIRMASHYPFDYLTKNKALAAQRGQLILGAQADMVQHDELLKVQSTWIAGPLVFSN